MKKYILVPVLVIILIIGIIYAFDSDYLIPENICGNSDYGDSYLKNPRGAFDYKNKLLKYHKKNIQDCRALYNDPNKYQILGAMDKESASIDLMFFISTGTRLYADQLIDLNKDKKTALNEIDKSIRYIDANAVCTKTACEKVKNDVKVELLRLSQSIKNDSYKPVGKK